MNEGFSEIPQDESLANKSENRKMVAKLEENLVFADFVLATQGREGAMKLLPNICNELILLNKSNVNNPDTQWTWNSEGDLTQKEFEDLNFKRKLLSNAIIYKSENRKMVENLEENFTSADYILATEGREKAMKFLPVIYNELMALNKRDASNYQTQWTWNPEGDLTQEEFDKLNLRRKLLSNTIGIKYKMPDGTWGIRHDLNQI